MMRWLIILFFVLACAWIVPVATRSSVHAGQADPPVLKPPVQDVEFSDEAVGAAIDKGTQFLYSVQKPDGSWIGYGMQDPRTHVEPYPVGPSALATYALLESGAGAQTPKMKMAIDWLAMTKALKTYELGLRCNVWLLVNKQLKDKYRANLRKDLDALIAIGTDGAFSYSAPVARAAGRVAPRVVLYDNSNSQYAVLGAWAAARDRSIEIGQGFWAPVLRHWLAVQNKDGGWGYMGGIASSGTMTCAGIASTLVCMDNLQSGDFLQCKTARTNASHSVEAGLEWLENNFTNGEAGVWPLYYYYGLERVGLASGMKYFGPTDWYKTVGKTILGMQQPDGSWCFQAADEPGKVVGTGYALLFLIRGREPLLFNKLQFNSIEKKRPLLSDWNCRPRDLAHLCAWIGDNFETTVNWQVINTRAPVSDWHDAPILYISGSQRPNFKPEEIEKLRLYVYQGGTIFSCAECSPEPGGGEFGNGMREAYAKIFPDHELTALDGDHDIYSRKVGFDLQGRPKFYMIANGVRPLAIHADEDLPKYWQANQVSTEKIAFQAASNLFMYVTDQGVLRSRASHTWPEEFKFSPPGPRPVATSTQPTQPTQASQPGLPPQPAASTQPILPPPVLPPQATGTVTIVRLKWDGNWNPEPLALERFSRLLAMQTHIQLVLADPADIADVAKSGATIAILSGQGKFQVKPEPLAALMAFAQNGGTVIVDAAGGDELFANTLAEILQKLNGGEFLGTLIDQHPIYSVAGLPDGTLVMPSKGNTDHKNTIQYRRKSRFRLGNDESKRFQLKALTVGQIPHERAAILFSREDLTNAGLVGYYSFPVDGYDPGAGLDGSAYRLMRNIVIYAMRDKGAQALKKLAHENDPPPPAATQPATNPSTSPTATQPAASKPATSKPA
jgi:hypothetical protein